MAKIIGRIDKKTGKLTLKVEGVEGEGCMHLEPLKKLTEGLGMEGEVEKTDEYYAQPEQQHLTEGT